MATELDRELERRIAKEKAESEKFVTLVKEGLAATGPITRPEVFDIVADQIEKAGTGLSRGGVLKGLRQLGKHYVRSREQEARSRS